MVRSRLQLPSPATGPSHSVRRCEPRKPNGSVLQAGPACTAPARSGVGAPSSAWPVAARPTAVPVSPMTSRAPAIVRRRNPTGVVCAAIFVVSWILLVFERRPLAWSPARRSHRGSGFATRSPCDLDGRSEPARGGGKGLAPSHRHHSMTAVG